MSDLIKFLNNSFDFSLTESQVEAANSLNNFFNGNKNCFILKEIEINETPLAQIIRYD